MPFDFIDIYELFDRKRQGDVSIAVLEKLQSWTLIAKNNTLKCHHGHYLKLCLRANCLDGYAWRCREYSTNSSRKKERYIFLQVLLIIVHSFTYLWTKSVSLSFLSEELGIAQHTAVDWAYFDREVVFDGMIIHHEKNGNYYLYKFQNEEWVKRKYHRGHAVEGQWIFSGTQRDNGACFLIPVEKRDKETLLAIIKEWVLPGTQIISDCWKKCTLSIYFSVSRFYHSVNFQDPNTGAHTSTVEGIWRHAKASLSQYSRKKHFYGGYMAKFIFFNKCRILNLDPIIEFFRLAGNLYDPNKYNNNRFDRDVSDDDDTDII
ncbi:DDE Tnp IS1595 domain-containing protein [Aphis craccivora]|uniref:DDE Tnp IS1595 domain-containing protein n=1 Tax=Aphis craccivora TaxID=307492 RepID=A0A6G0YD46_APHCR|nr:DDE Tnp IS1595 domain-containing protein [Aphis craccivora]